MPFDWEDYLGLARHLASDSTEARLRSSVSRAYYLAFKLAMNWASSNGFTPTLTGEDHKLIWPFMVEKARAKGDMSAAKDLLDGSTLRARRRVCDYDDDIPGLTQDRAIFWIDKAEKIKDTIATL